jgi:hypothetical protein
MCAILLAKAQACGNLIFYSLVRHQKAVRMEMGLPDTNGMDAPTPTGIEICQSGVSKQPLEQIGASTMKVTTVGIDLAKNVF